ncbi:hypothetical protein KAF25_002964 [Fusarium avenaceum]|uniref:NB-ARC domain-containing protein n=1 Tax=Fusarium avenaceum TaxID=40199 RepID=A0A9P7KRZ1_9HYPO|nr:hypothetical protein KAF25_002964 [Fusarium avenaceum]
MMELQGEAEKDLLYRFCAFHSQFQNQMVPVDLIKRACEKKVVWSSSGSLKHISPMDAGVPYFLLIFWETYQHSLSTDGIFPDPSHIKLVTINGQRYIELNESYFTSANLDDEYDQELAFQCVQAFIHAFPTRNMEILGEDIAVRLMPSATSFILPILASISIEDIKIWLLPKDRDRTTDYVLSFCDCLQQIFLLLGRGNPSSPLGFLDKMLDALCNDPSPEIEGSDSIHTIIRMVKASITLEPGQLAAVTSGISDERNNAWLGSLFTLMPNMQIPEELSKIVRTWNPLSQSEPSAMEYLIAVILLSEEQLRLISPPTSLSGELAIIYGLLLSRKGLHGAATRVLFDNLPFTITAYGQGSLEVGIVAAECANCYNMLRQENIANRIATRFLALRTSPYLSNRQDWFFLSLSRIDSLIGTGEYHQADLGLQNVMAKPSIPTSIYAMSCLRLSKIRRRTAGTLNPKAIPGTAVHLQTGIKLFAQVPTVLQQEILEEVACELATKHCLDQEIPQAESLMNTVNNHLSTMTIDTTPAQSRYEKTQSSVKERILHEKDVPRISPKEQRQATSVHGQNTFPHTTLAKISTSTGEGTRKLFMVPHPRHPKFVPRVEVTIITELLTRPQMPNICLVYGEAGIGKSSIATEVVYSCHQDFDVIIWVESGSTSEVNRRLHSIATGLGIDGLTDSSDGHARARECMIEWLKQPFTTNRFSSKPVEYLIVFDGFGNEEALKPFWPSNSTPCSVLVTARNIISLPRIYNRYTNPHEIKVGFLSSPQATRLLDYSMDWWCNEARESTSPVFEHHPVAILKTELSRRSRGHSAWRTEDDFKGKLKSFMNREDFKSELNHSTSLIMLWFVDFASQKARDLLDVISFLQESGTPETLLYSCTLPSRASNELVMTADEFELARDELLEFSLIWKTHETDTLTTSTCIASMIRDHMSPGRFDYIYATTLSLLRHVWPCTLDNMNYVSEIRMGHSGRCSSFWPQARELKRRSQSIGVHDLSPKTYTDCLQVLLDIAWCATGSSQYQEAEGYHTMASVMFSRLEVVSLSQIESSKDLRPPYRPTRIDFLCLSFHHQAWLYFKSGKLEMGLESFNQCLQWLDEGFELRDQRNFQDTGNSLRASVLQGLGMLKLQTEQVGEAVEQYTCCLRMMDLSPVCFGRRRDITIRIQKGYAHLMNNQPKEAEASFIGASDLAKTFNVEELFDTQNFPIKLLSSYGLLKYGLTLAKLNQNAVDECLEMAFEFLSLCSYDDQLKGATYIIMSCCNARKANWYLAM